MVKRNQFSVSMLSWLTSLAIIVFGCHAELQDSSLEKQEGQKEMPKSNLQFEIQKIRAEIASLDTCHLVGNVPQGKLSAKKAFLHLLTPPEREAVVESKHLVGVLGGDLLSSDSFVVTDAKTKGDTAIFSVDLIRPELGDGKPWRAIAFYKLKLPADISQVLIVFKHINNAPETSMNLKNVRAKISKSKGSNKSKGSGALNETEQ